MIFTLHFSFCGHVKVNKHKPKLLRHMLYTPNREPRPTWGQEQQFLTFWQMESWPQVALQPNSSNHKLIIIKRCACKYIDDWPAETLYPHICHAMMFVQKSSQWSKWTGTACKDCNRLITNRSSLLFSKQGGGANGKASKLEMSLFLCRLRTQMIISPTMAIEGCALPQHSTKTVPVWRTTVGNLYQALF